MKDAVQLVALLALLGALVLVAGALIGRVSKLAGGAM